MVYIGLDVSKISTALVIENNGVTKIYNYTTKKENNIWVQNTNNFINYSDKELIKLDEFDKITDLIIEDIFNNLKLTTNAKIAIEGYSYNSKGPIFDLIEFTTILKHKLLKKVDNTIITITFINF